MDSLEVTRSLYLSDSLLLLPSPKDWSSSRPVTFHGHLCPADLFPVDQRTWCFFLVRSRPVLSLPQQGYGRLQILLAYLLPEVLDVSEDNLEASQLATPVAKANPNELDAQPGREDTAATLSDLKPNFTITSLAPSKGYGKVGRLLFFFPP